MSPQLRLGTTPNRRASRPLIRGENALKPMTPNRRASRPLLEGKILDNRSGGIMGVGENPWEVNGAGP